MDIKIENVNNLQGLTSIKKTENKLPARVRAATDLSVSFPEEAVSEKIEDIRRKIEEFLRTINKNTRLRMRYDKEIDRVIVTILEAGTEKVIRQIPPEEFVSFLKRFRESLNLIFEMSI